MEAQTLLRRRLRTLDWGHQRNGTKWYFLHAWVSDLGFMPLLLFIVILIHVATDIEVVFLSEEL